MHTKTSMHTHTDTDTYKKCTHTDTERNFNFPQLNSIPDVLAVDRRGGRKKEMAVPHF